MTTAANEPIQNGHSDTNTCTGTPTGLISPPPSKPAEILSPTRRSSSRQPQPSIKYPTCAACGVGSIKGDLFSCRQCNKSYHWECIDPRPARKPSDRTIELCNGCSKPVHLDEPMTADDRITADETDTRSHSNGQQQQESVAGEHDSDNRRRHSDGDSSHDSHKETASRKRQRIHDSDEDDDVTIVESPLHATAASRSSADSAQQRKELTVTNPNQLPSSTPRSPPTPDSDREVDDDTPLVLRPTVNRRRSTDKQPTAAAATSTPSTPATSVKSPFSTSSSGKRRLSKSTKTPTPATPSTSAPAMSPSPSTKPSLTATKTPTTTTTASPSPPTSAPTTPPGASPTSGAASRVASSHMNEKLTEAIGAASGGAAFAESVALFLVAHKLSLRETRDLYFRLLSNLRSNTQLLARVRSGEITAEQLCTMSEADMAGDEVRRQREEAKKASIRDVTMAKETMIAKQTKAGVEYIAVAGDKLTRTDMFDEKLTLTGTEGKEEGDETEENEMKETDAVMEGKQSEVSDGLGGNGAAVAGEDEFLSFEEIERRQRESNGSDYESKYASDVEDDDVVEQPRASPTSKRGSDTVDNDESMQAATKRSKTSHSSLSVDTTNDGTVNVNVAVNSEGHISLVLSPRSASDAATQLASSAADSIQADRRNVIELDMEQPTLPTDPATSAVPASSTIPGAGTTPTKPTSTTTPLSPLPALSPATPPQSPPSVIPLPSLQPVANSSAASLFLGPLQSASRWSGQLYFNGHNTTIAFTGRLMGVAGQSQSNTAVKALSTLPAPSTTINIAGREPTSEAAKLLNECITSPRLMALLYILRPTAADAAAMEQFCAFHADKQRVAIADMRRDNGLFYRFGRMGAMGESMGRELPLELFTRCFSGVKGLKDARSYYCVVVFAAKRTAGGVGSDIAPQRQESSSSLSSVASSESNRVSSSRQRSNQANVVTPPPSAQPMPVYSAFPAAPAAAPPSTFTSPPFASPAAVPTPMLPPAPSALPPTVAPSVPAGYAGYQQPPPAVGYYMPPSQYPGYLPAIPEQLMPSVPPQLRPSYVPAQFSQPAYPLPPQYHSQPQSQPQPHPPSHQPAAPSAGAAAANGPPPAATSSNTDWIQVRKFLESIKTLGTSSPSTTSPSPSTSQPPAMPPPSPPRPQQPSNAPHHSPRREDGGGGRQRDYDKARVGRVDNDRDGAPQMDARRRYEIEVQLLEQEKERLDSLRLQTERTSRDGGRPQDRERQGERDRSSSERDRRREYDRDAERGREWDRDRERERDRTADQPRVYDSSRERERERERAESQQRSRAGGGGGRAYESQRERIDRELREAQRERERLAQFTDHRHPAGYPPPPQPSSSSQQPPPKTVSGFIHPSRLAQAPR